MQTNHFPEALYSILSFEVFILILLLAGADYLFYKFFLTRVSKERHLSIRGHLKNIFYHSIVFSVLYTAFELGMASAEYEYIAKKLLPYLASFLFLSGVIVFIKSCRLFVLQYLFLGSMRAGVPLLLVNIFSLVLSMGIGFWTLSRIFGIDLTPVLATSAAFSIVLGLALQDTLGNLFAGISIQIDKTFEIGDWIEVQNGSTTIVGQVKELSWRSTLLIGFSEEMITLPNKLVAGAQISNYTPEESPIMRSQTFKVHHKDDLDKVKDILEMATSQVSDVCAIPSPFAYVRDINENFIVIRVLYFITNYGSQFVIGDKVISTCLKQLHQNGFNIAHQIVELKNDTRK